ncbi:MAG: hypothetical protein IT204_24845 [Fimbriimonadaceae bacterium]|nr:hypothetical protein [Fimbriimonadaceae bacterium]
MSSVVLDRLLWTAAASYPDRTAAGLRQRVAAQLAALEPAWQLAVRLEVACPPDLPPDSRPAADLLATWRRLAARPVDWLSQDLRPADSCGAAVVELLQALAAGRAAVVAATDPWLRRALLSCGRLARNGSLQVATAVALATATEAAGLPELLSSRPDAPGPLLWVAATAGEPAAWLADAIDAGLPLSGVVTAGDFDALPDASLERCLLVLSTGTAEGVIARLRALAERGTGVLLHGSTLDCPAVQQWLGLQTGAPAPAGCRLRDTRRGVTADWPASAALPTERLDLTAFDALPLAVAEAGAETWAYAVRRGAVGWVHGPAGHWLLELPALLGWTWQQLVRPGGRPAAFVASWQDNGLCLAGCQHDATTALQLALPDGAPVPTGLTAALHDGVSHLHPEWGVHYQCRVFVRQEGGAVRVEAIPSPEPGLSSALRISGLQDAVLSIRLPRERLEDAAVDGGDAVIFDEQHGAVVAFGVSGEFLVAW